MARNPAVKLACNQRWRANNKEKSREASDNWRQNNKARHNETRAKWRARIKAENPELVTQQNRKWALKKVFGMTVEEFEMLLAEQNGGCAICGGPPVAGKKNLSVDHDHETGANRGLLCGLCNFALCRVEQDAGWGEKALRYLHKYKGVTPCPQ
jgi:hypothetical protein